MIVTVGRKMQSYTEVNKKHYVNWNFVREKKMLSQYRIMNIEYRLKMQIKIDLLL